MLKNSLIGLAIATSSIASIAYAGDATPDFSSWEGRYVGLTLGSVFSNSKTTLGDYSADIIALDVSNGLFPQSWSRMKAGMSASAAVGYNMQSGNLVYGAEADFGFSDFNFRQRSFRIDPNDALVQVGVDGTGAPIMAPLFLGAQTNVTVKTRIDKFATARLRAGYAMGRNYVYGTGGLAAGYVSNLHRVDMPNFPVVPGYEYHSPNWAKDGWLLGYTIGAGFERKLTEKVSVKAEGLYVNLANRTVRGEDPSAFPGSFIDYKFHNDFYVARAGVNMKF